MQGENRIFQVFEERKREPGICIQQTDFPAQWAHVEVSVSNGPGNKAAPALPRESQDLLRMPAWPEGPGPSSACHAPLLLRVPELSHSGRWSPFPGRSEVPGPRRRHLVAAVGRRITRSPAGARPPSALRGRGRLHGKLSGPRACGSPASEAGYRSVCVSLGHAARRCAVRRHSGCP